MINKNNELTFQVGNRHKYPETELREELLELKIEKLDNRLLLLAIIIPVMIGIIFVFAYNEFNNRVDQTFNTQAAIIQKISRDLEAKISLLSLEQAEIKDIYLKKMPSFEQSISLLQSSAEATQSSLEKLKSSSISRQEMSETVASLYGKNSELSDRMVLEINTLKDSENQRSNDVEAVSNNLNTLTRIMTEMQERFETLNSDLSNLAYEKVGKKELDLALKQTENGQRQELLKIKTTIDKKIDGIAEQPENLPPIQSQTFSVHTIRGSKVTK